MKYNQLLTLLVLGAYHSDLIFLYVSRWSPPKSHYHLSSYKALANTADLFPLLYLHPREFIYSVTLKFFFFICLTDLTYLPLPQPLWQPPVFSLFLWLCFVCSFILFLDSTYKQKSYGICLSGSLFNLAYHSLEIHLCCHRWKDFILYYSCVILHFIYIHQQTHTRYVSFNCIYWWLLPCLGWCTRCSSTWV